MRRCRRTGCPTSLGSRSGPARTPTSSMSGSRRTDPRAAGSSPRCPCRRTADAGTHRWVPRRGRAPNWRTRSPIAPRSRLGRRRTPGRSTGHRCMMGCRAPCSSRLRTRRRTPPRTGPGTACAPGLRRWSPIPPRSTQGRRHRRRRSRTRPRMPGRGAHRSSCRWRCRTMAHRRGTPPAPSPRTRHPTPCRSRRRPAGTPQCSSRPARIRRWALARSRIPRW